MDFSNSPELTELRERVRVFIRGKIIPYERDPRQTPHGPNEELRRELIAHGKAAGLLSLHVSKEFGGLGLDHRSKAVVFEEAGYSLLGPVALNISAPDEGNMHLLEAVAGAAHKERWLRPLAAGEIRSCFCMTEPPPGAGSDPSMLKTTAVRDGDDFIINGRKWFTTGADGAAVAIIMARTEDGRATMFLCDTARPGFVVERAMNAMDSCFPGGHSVVRFENLRVPAADILGALGEGFRHAQVRLSPARLTHCMRWLGAARRAHDIATEYARHREAFGKTLGQHEGVSFMLADNEIDLHAARLAIWHTAWVLDQNRLGIHESSVSKVLASEAEWRVADRCVQILGGQGTTDEFMVAKIFNDMRAFRIYDGPSEVHRWSIGKRVIKGIDLSL